MEGCELWKLHPAWIDQNSTPVKQYGQLNKPPNGLYRKKTPSELRRDKQRKDEYLRKKYSRDSSQQKTVSETTKRDSPGTSDVTKSSKCTSANNDNVPNHASHRQGVKTRLMARHELPECPRGPDTPSSMRSIASDAGTSVHDSPHSTVTLN